MLTKYFRWNRSEQTKMKFEAGNLFLGSNKQSWKLNPVDWAQPCWIRIVQECVDLVGESVEIVSVFEVVSTVVTSWLWCYYYLTCGVPNSKHKLFRRKKIYVNSFFFRNICVSQRKKRTRFSSRNLKFTNHVTFVSKTIFHVIWSKIIFEICLARRSSGDKMLANAH